MSDLFRKKAMDRVSSPEDLNEYIKVITPSVWLLLTAIIILLVGMVVWSIAGSVNVNEADGTQRTVHPIEFVIN
ncbi:MAG TPA: hypothetical protein DCG85_00615 [Lachnospiraceae bacterium]|nr:hypothetical protein [Lachnospiraceae bacterium]